MCTERFVDPFTDFGFKLLFGTPANKDFLIEFLNSILGLENKITGITYNNTEVFGNSADDRKAVYDLYCTTEDGSHIIVEMQNAYQRFFMDRTVYYSSFPIQAAARQGDWDYRLPHIYTIAFLNFNMSEYAGNPGYKHVVKLTDVDTGRVFFDKLTYVYLEMPKFDKKEDDLHEKADVWLYVIKNLALLNERPQALQDKVFKRFFRAAEIAHFSPEDRAAYETSLKIMRDYNNTVRSAEEKGLEKGRMQGRMEGRKEGLEEGIAKGRREGIAKGRQEGIAKGRQEGIEAGEKAKAVEIARKLKLLGMSGDEILKATGIHPSDL